MIHLLNITLQRKGDGDWRAFLLWGDSVDCTKHEIRGYGSTAGHAADDAYRRYIEDKCFYTENTQPWV